METGIYKAQEKDAWHLLFLSGSEIILAQDSEASSSGSPGSQGNLLAL